MKTSSLATSARTRRAEHHRSGHVGNEAPMHFAHAELCVGMHEADVGAERDLDSTTERVAVDRGDHRHGDLLPHPTHLLAEMRDPPLHHRARAPCRRSAPGGRRSPSTGRRRSRGRRRTTMPSPLRTTARTPCSVFRRSPISARAWNIAPSRALRLSGRFMRTSATPSEIVTVTRSDMSRVLQIPGPACDPAATGRAIPPGAGRSAWSTVPPTAGRRRTPCDVPGRCVR